MFSFFHVSFLFYSFFWVSALCKCKQTQRTSRRIIKASVVALVVVVINMLLQSCGQQVHLFLHLHLLCCRRVAAFALTLALLALSFAAVAIFISFALLAVLLLLCQQLAKRRHFYICSLDMRLRALTFSAPS